ncbi:MAG: hypothetical protein OYH77_04080 [Pseudomonadota bacterium]|nr:hypothetical protein [Pseudomonadota bacterium]
MRVYVSLLVACLLTTSVGYARGVLPAASRIDYIRGAIFSLVEQREFVEALAWDKGGVTIDAVIQYLDDYYPDVFSFYKTGWYSNFYSDTGLRIVVGRSLEKAMVMRGDVFSMQIKQQNGERVRKYFSGEKPDLIAIVGDLQDEAGFIPRANDILHTIKQLRPDVYDLYVQASADNSDQGLRIAIGKARAQYLSGR